MINSGNIHKGWFSEICPMWEGIALSLKVEKLLYSKKSMFQQIDLYQTRSHGRMLVLDGIIQLTEQDEFSYHEMMAHLPLLSHPNPEHVLVVGGGDGGVLREINRHDDVRFIDFCEIDQEVINVSKQFLPSIACGFNDPRVTVHIRDGAAFVRECSGCYDVIIVDSSDPVGPGEILFKSQFYRDLKHALKPGGLIATQGENFFLHPDWVEKLMGVTRSLFPIYAYANIIVPTYTGGHIGICMGSLGPKLTTPARRVPQVVQSQLKYYSPEVHRAAFVLPYFAEKILKDKGV
ncbi:MAG TPA: spermidine synthase [Desulfobacter sp.]|uniref:spermidine synthase n=1 Tax=Desulfobacter sp. TaxID=2294 RepID=UPI000E8C1B9E|nr:spermidine synthase [Desulfobacter sp.]MDQ1270405.1 spermidine synthase [Thermodesulfobacteriota bacterium]MBP8830403.1 spermidine synthase [Desulfobacter sp.]MBP9597692.1 spermidine synthase [Desulfobacter sp.]HAR33150.1 spermidine synthase [Desulfobacter sp.]HBT90204.1 spermidine synthase [Desulfobacter sp.]